MLRSRTAAAAFSHISRSDLAAGLEVRIEEPTLIDQASANLCGPAAFVYDMAAHSRVIYVNFVIDLYENGKATLGNFVIEPSDVLKQYQLPSRLKGGGKVPDPADWIPMASIRNAKGSFVFWDRYDNVEDAASGITTPGNLRTWLDEVGYQKVVEKTSVAGLSRSDAKKSLAEAVAKTAEGYKVFLLIRSTLLEGEEKQKKKSLGTFPNHWVVLESGFVAETSVSLTVYSWGGKRKIPPSGSGWGIDDVAARYYGFIAAQY